MADTVGRRTALQIEFGSRVRAQRRKLGWSQEALALAAGLHRTYIGSLESGERNPAITTAAKLARALSVDLCELVQGLQALDED